MLYQKYNYLFKNNEINTGFSKRLPDYAQEYKFNLLEKSIKQTNMNHFLDIGAGLGRLSILLLNTYFMSGCSLEINTDKIEWNKILKQNTTLELKEGLLQNIIPSLIEKNRKFDFILMSEVFEHIPLKDVDSFLNSLSRICTKDTKIFLTTPNGIVQGPAEKSSRWYKIQKYGHHKHYTYSELKDIFSKYNFKIDWHAYESSNIKRNFYNKLFYPISRIDQKFVTTKKLPVFFKNIYKFASLPVIFVAKIFFWNLAKLVCLTEKYFNNKINSETIILQISKK